MMIIAYNRRIENCNEKEGILIVLRNLFVPKKIIGYIFFKRDIKYLFILC